MPLGDSKGAFYEDEFRMEAAPWFLDPKLDAEMVVDPKTMQTNKQLDKAELEPSTGTGIEVNWLTDMFGSKDAIKTIPADPVTQYPTQDEAKEAIKYGFGYGSGNESYINAEVARVFADKKGNLLKVTGRPGDIIEDAAGEDFTKNEDLTKLSNLGLRERIGTLYAQGALAVNRIPIAAIGFDPGSTTIDAEIKNPTIGGLTKSGGGQMYLNLANKSTVVHESIHNGLAKLVKEDPEAKKLVAKGPATEETLVRYMMYKYAGDPEKGLGDISDKERASAIQIFEKIAPDYKNVVEKLQERAIEYLKNKRPGGPR